MRCNIPARESGSTFVRGFHFSPPGLTVQTQCQPVRWTPLSKNPLFLSIRSAASSLFNVWSELDDSGTPTDTSPHQTLAKPSRSQFCCLMLKSVKPGEKRGKPKERMKGIKQFGQLWPQIQVGGLEKADRSIWGGEDRWDWSDAGHWPQHCFALPPTEIPLTFWHHSETPQTLSELTTDSPPSLMIPFVIFGLVGFENCNVAMSTKSNENIQKMTTKA